MPKHLGQQKKDTNKYLSQDQTHLVFNDCHFGNVGTAEMGKKPPGSEFFFIVGKTSEKVFEYPNSGFVIKEVSRQNFEIGSFLRRNRSSSRSRPDF